MVIRLIKVMILIMLTVANRADKGDHVDYCDNINNADYGKPVDNGVGYYDSVKWLRNSMISITLMLLMLMSARQKGI